jgi:hypothetical protein
MLVNATDEVARHADVKDTVRAISQNIDIASSHAAMMKGVDGRDKPGHDGRMQ